MTHKQVVDFLVANHPLAHWTLTGNTYSGFTWLDSPETKPTAEELGL